MSSFSRTEVSKLSASEMSRLCLPEIGNDIDISWSWEFPNKLDFLDLERIPSGNAVRLLRTSTVLSPGSVPIRSIKLLCSGILEYFLPVAAYRYWLDIHNLMPRVGEVLEAMAWLNEMLPYNSKVIYPFFPQSNLITDTRILSCNTH